jgi:hypothetical protein
MLKDKFFFSAANVLADSGAFDIYVALSGLDQNLNSIGAVIKLDPEGNTVWVNEYNDFPDNIDVNDEGFVSVGFLSGFLRKFSPTGGLIYASGGPRASRGNAIDSDGFVYNSYSGFFGTEYRNAITKYNPSGTAILDYKLDQEVYGAVCIDKNGFVYNLGLADFDFTIANVVIRKFNSNLNLIWDYTTTSLNSVARIAVDKDGFVYANSDNGDVIKLNSSGNLVWQIPGIFGLINDIAVDRDGFVYSAAGFGETLVVRKISPAGNVVWNFVGDTFPSSQIFALAVDPNGFVYAGGNANSFRKIDPDGNQVAFYTFPYGNPSIRGVAVSPGRLTVSQDL